MQGWYFAAEDRKLRYDDGRLVEKGVTHEVDCTPVLCEKGLHASKRIIDALEYAPGPILCRVELSGVVVHGDDKSCATKRTYIEVIDATALLRDFARKCALDVIHLWAAPAVVRTYLETGDELLRIAASAAASAAVRAAASAAAWDAARAAAKAAAWAAASAAARGAAGYAAGVAARAAQNQRLEEMARRAMGLPEPRGEMDEIRQHGGT